MSILPCVKTAWSRQKDKTNSFWLEVRFRQIYWNISLTWWNSGNTKELLCKLVHRPTWYICSGELLSRARLFATPWTAARSPSLSFNNSKCFLKIMSIELVVPSNHLILCDHLLCLYCFQASGSFPMSQIFTCGGQSPGVSASVFPMNTQDWFTLQLTGLISL